jgi:hypothetical protein
MLSSGCANTCGFVALDLVVDDRLIRRLFLSSNQSPQERDSFHPFLQLFARIIVGVGPVWRRWRRHGDMLTLSIVLRIESATGTRRSQSIRQCLGTRGALEDLLLSRERVSGAILALM